MELDLTVLPDIYYDSKIESTGSHRLQFNRDIKLFERIRRMKSQPLPEGRRISLGSYKDEELIFYTHDDFGEPLRQVEASEFMNMWLYSHIQTDPINQAILVYLRSLPPQMPVVLYWH